MATNQLLPELHNCTACRLSEPGINPVPGRLPGTKSSVKYLFIGISPGKDENQTRESFTGAAAEYLDDLVKLAGMNLEECYFTNIVKCWPQFNIQGKQKKPGKIPMATCSEKWLIGEILDLKPEVIITLGADPLSVLYPQHRISDVHGQLLDADKSSMEVVRQLNVPVVAMIHPAAVLHQPDNKVVVDADFRNLPSKIGLAESGDRYTPPYEFIDTDEKLGGVLQDISELESKTPVAFDFETTDLRTHIAESVGVSVAWKNRSVYIPADNKGLQNLTPLWNHVGLRAHNTKYEMGILRTAGIQLHTVPDDTMILASLLGKTKGLKPLVMQTFGYQMQSIEELIGKGKNQISMADVPPKTVGPYASDDSHFTLKLWDVLAAEMTPALWWVYDNIEKPLLEAVVPMEQQGCLLDKDKVLHALAQLQGEYDTLLTRVRSDLGLPNFNPRSPVQTKSILNDAIFQHNIETGDKIKAVQNTNAQTLEIIAPDVELAHDIVQLRHLSKLHSTYGLGLAKMLPRAFGSVNPTGTGTGRFSYSGWRVSGGDQWGINLQTIPKPKVWEDYGNSESNLIRQCFIADVGSVLIELDYSQIELRVAAHIANCRSMIKTYRNGGDIHNDMQRLAKLADFMPNADPDAVRRIAKIMNFGLLYEFLDRSAANVLIRAGAEAGVQFDFRTALGMVNAKREAQPEISNYYATIRRQIQTRGYVETETGRTLDIPWLSGWGDEVEWKNAARLREAINMPIQGTAADIMKLAIIALWKNKPAWMKFVWTVHDSLLIMVPKGKEQESIDWARPIMTGVMSLRVPLEVDAKIGINLAEMKEEKEYSFG